MTDMSAQEFAEEIDQMIKENNVYLIIHSPEDSEIITVDDNMDHISILQWYLTLNALPSIGKSLFGDLTINKSQWDEMIDKVVEMLRKELKSCIEEPKEERVRTMVLDLFHSQRIGALGISRRLGVPVDKVFEIIKNDIASYIQSESTEGSEDSGSGV